MQNYTLYATPCQANLETKQSKDNIEKRSRLGGKWTEITENVFFPQKRRQLTVHHTRNAVHCNNIQNNSLNFNGRLHSLSASLDY